MEKMPLTGCYGDAHGGGGMAGSEWEEEAELDEVTDGDSPRKSQRPRARPRPFSPDKIGPKRPRRVRRPGGGRRKRSNTISLLPDKLPNGQPFCCDLCHSQYIVAKERKRSGSCFKPKPRHKVDPYTGKTLTLCNACGLAFDRPRKQKKRKKICSEAQKEQMLQEAKMFGQSLSEKFNDPLAANLYCPLIRHKACGCLQNYVISGAPGMEEGSNETSRAEYLLKLLHEAKCLSTQKFYSPEQASKPKKKRNIGLGNGMRKSKAFEDFVIETRQRLRQTLNFCERATQKVLCYSNNFIHKKLKSEHDACRAQRQIGKAALGLLTPLESLDELSCCTDRCVKMAGTHLRLLEEWRERSKGGQEGARRVLAEMLTPSGGSRPNCYKFISMVTGRSLSLIGSVNEQMRRTGGERKPPIHGLKKYWREKLKRDKESGDAERNEVLEEMNIGDCEGPVTTTMTTQDETETLASNEVNSTAYQFALQRQQLLQLQQQLAEQQAQIQQHQQLVQQQLQQTGLVQQQLQQTGLVQQQPLDQTAMFQQQMRPTRRRQSQQPAIQPGTDGLMSQMNQISPGIGQVVITPNGSGELVSNGQHVILSTNQQQVFSEAMPQQHVQSMFPNMYAPSMPAIQTPPGTQHTNFQINTSVPHFVQQHSPQTNILQSQMLGQNHSSVQTTLPQHPQSLQQAFSPVQIQPSGLPQFNSSLHTVPLNIHASQGQTFMPTPPPLHPSVVPPLQSPFVSPGEMHQHPSLPHQHQTLQIHQPQIPQAMLYQTSSNGQAQIPGQVSLSALQTTDGQHHVTKPPAKTKSRSKKGTTKRKSRKAVPSGSSVVQIPLSSNPTVSAVPNQEDHQAHIHVSVRDPQTTSEDHNYFQTPERPANASDDHLLRLSYPVSPASEQNAVESEFLVNTVPIEAEPVSVSEASQGQTTNPQSQIIFNHHLQSVSSLTVDPYDVNQNGHVGSTDNETNVGQASQSVTINLSQVGADLPSGVSVQSTTLTPVNVNSLGNVVHSNASLPLSIAPPSATQTDGGQISVTAPNLQTAIQYILGMVNLQGITSLNVAETVGNPDSSLVNVVTSPRLTVSPTLTSTSTSSENLAAGIEGDNVLVPPHSSEHSPCDHSQESEITSSVTEPHENSPPSQESPTREVRHSPLSSDMMHLLSNNCD